MSSLTTEDFDGESYERPLDHKRLASQLLRVQFRMRDGRWYTLDELVASCGGTAASISARVRDLRKEKFGAHVIIRKREARGLFRYRMVLQPVQVDFFEQGLQS